MTTPAKKAAPRLGPNAPAANSQPPWAMVSADGADLYFPTKQEDAIAFARDHGAQPVDPNGFPWPSILDDEGKINLDDDEAGAPADEAPPEAPGAAESEQGGPTDADAAPTPPAPVRPARKATRKAAPAEPSPVDALGCPTPDVCWPVGLPDNCSYVTCVHGGWQVG